MGEVAPDSCFLNEIFIVNEYFIRRFDNLDCTIYLHIQYLNFISFFIWWFGHVRITSDPVNWKKRKSSKAIVLFNIQF